jgi:flagellar biosynthesis/type III secretory pathway protein FliH
MVTKELIKREVDRLPESLLEEVYHLLKRVVSQKKEKKVKLSLHDFKGQLDQKNLRKEAYE